MNRVSWIYLALLMAWSTPAFGEGDPAVVVQQANDAYQAALSTTDRGARLEAFRTAERLYAKSLDLARDVDQRVTADLWVNYGNAALQAERLGAAVLGFRQALALDPNHARARKNLRHARTLLPSWVRPPESGGVMDTFFFWHQGLSPIERHTLAAIAFAIAGLLIAFSIRTGRSGLRTLAILPLAVWIALITSTVFDAVTEQRPEGVLTAPETVGRSADSHNVAPRFSEPLPGGTEITIVERRSPWVHVELLNGRDAWVVETAISEL